MTGQIPAGLEGPRRELPCEPCPRCREMGEVTVAVWTAEDGSEVKSHFRCGWCLNAWWKNTR